MLVELIKQLNEGKYLDKYPLAIDPLLLGLYAEHYQMSAESFGSKTIGDIFAYCKDNNISQKELIECLEENLAHPKQFTTEECKRWERTKLELMTGGIVICEQLAQKYKDDQVWCEDRLKLTTYNELLKFRKAQLTKVKQELDEKES